MEWDYKYLCNLCLLGVSRAIALKMLARPANRLAAATLQSSSDRRRPGGPSAVFFLYMEICLIIGFNVKCCLNMFEWELSHIILCI